MSASTWTSDDSKTDLLRKIVDNLYEISQSPGGATPGGSSGDVQYNNAGALGGLTGLTTSGGVLQRGTFSANGAASAPAFSLTGNVFTGGTSTTTKPLALIETTGATSNNWNTSGTMLGVNAPNGFTGDLLKLQTHGTTAFVVDRVGQVTALTSMQTPSFWENSGNSFYASSSVGGTQTKNTGYFGFSTSGNAWDTVGVRWRAGAGSPEGAIAAPIGSLYSQTDGGALTSLWVKESGSGNTGWAAK